MMDLTRWLRLFEIDPELKPPGLEHNPGEVTAAEDLDGEKTLPVWTISCDGISIDPEPGDEWKQDGDDEPELVSIIPTHTAAALIRDKAVWWLVEQQHKRKDFPWMRLGRKSIFENKYGFLLGDPFNPEIGVKSDDPTEALYLACCKVLGVEP